MNLSDLGISPRSALDCGSNVGSWTREALQAWPGISVHMIEANESCRGALADVGVPFTIACLGDTKRKVTFFQRKGGGTDTGNSYYRELTSFFDEDQIDQREMELSTLDDLFPDGQFDLIKLDCQGAELDILRGGKRLIEGTKWILMEVAIEPYNQDAPLYHEVMMFMTGIGFGPHREVGNIVHPLDHSRIMQKDMLFSRSV